MKNYILPILLLSGLTASGQCHETVTHAYGQVVVVTVCGSEGWVNQYSEERWQEIQEERAAEKAAELAEWEAEQAAKKARRDSINAIFDAREAALKAYNDSVRMEVELAHAERCESLKSLEAEIADRTDSILRTMPEMSRKEKKAARLELEELSSIDTSCPNIVYPTPLKKLPTR